MNRPGSMLNALAMAGFAVAGMAIGNAKPHVQNTTTVHNEIHRKIVKRVEMVRRIPVAVPVPEALARMRRACGGDPVRILRAAVYGTSSGSNTYLQVLPLDDQAQVSCNMSGDYTDEYKPGVIARLTAKVDHDPAGS